MKQHRPGITSRTIRVLKPMLEEAGCSVKGIARTEEEARRCAECGWARGHAADSRLAVHLARGFGIAAMSMLPPDDYSREILSSGMTEAGKDAQREAEMDACVIVHAPWGPPLYIGRALADRMSSKRRSMWRSDVMGVVMDWMDEVRRDMDAVNATMAEVRAAVERTSQRAGDIDIRPILEDVGTLWNHPEHSPSLYERPTIVVVTNWRSLRWFEPDWRQQPRPLRCALVRSDDLDRWIPFEPGSPGGSPGGSQGIGALLSDIVTR